MSNRIYFDLAEAVRIGEATVQATEHTDSFSDREDGTKTGPALMWVKDAGTYLMSNAVPRPENDVLYGRAYRHDGLLLKQPDDSSTEGWDDVWDTTRDICGGDDFAEYFPLGDLLPAMQAQLQQGFTHLAIEVSDESLEIFMEKEKS
jgi:hypothetical protein